MNYPYLGIKTNYNILSSLVDIKTLIKKAVEYHINALAITDTNMFGVMEFYKECKSNNIKPIIGIEILLENKPIILYAINYEGYQNLTRLTYTKQNEDLSIEYLKHYSQNLICIVPYLSIELYEKIRGIYSNLYLSYKSIDERNNLKDKLEKMIYLDDVLYINKNDYNYLKYLYLIRDNKKRDSIDEYTVNLNSYLMNYEDYSRHIHSSDMKNINEIVNLCNISFEYNAELLPVYNSKKDFNSYEYLTALCKKGLDKRFNGSIENIYIERLKFELDIINKMGFNNYFLVVFDFVQYAKKNGILVGPGRGSAAGSLVSYALGITDVDPIKYNLFFERFLNPERVTMPDIDIDFESTRRSEVVDYVINKYGPKQVAPIITFVELGSRQVIRDLGRIFDIDTISIDKLSKQLNSMISLKDNLEDKVLKENLSNNKLLQDIYKIGMKLEGSKRQISTHAAGVIISSKELFNYIPMQKYDYYYITGYSMEHLEELGLLKIDFLGIQNLTLIDNVLKKIKESDKDFSFNNIPLDDKKTLDLFKMGKTSGIFQFESAGMKSFLIKLKPGNFEDLVAANALFRPGPMANIDTFIKRKEGQLKIDYLVPNLEPILKPTYGVIVYQEQIMQIANIMAGYSLGEADILRRAMSKKKKEILEQEEAKFIERSVNKGNSREDAKKIYDLILAFANYGFNRSHSVGYSLVGYKMAYLKVHYPNIFISNLLSNVIGNASKIKEYVDEAKSLSIKILKPDINKSDTMFIEEGNDIRYSLSAIANVGAIAASTIVKERENGIYIDFYDFVGRLYGRAITRKTIESLIAADVFATFGFNHQTLMYNLEAAINYADIIKTIDARFVEKPEIELLQEYSNEDLMKKELEVLGLYLSSHPVANYTGRYENIIYSNQLENYFDKFINMVIYIDRTRIIDTKNKEKMMFADASDEYGNVNLVLFPNTLKNNNNLVKGNIILVSGKVEKRMSSYQLNVSKLQIIDKI